MGPEMGQPARHRAEDEPEPDLADLKRRFADLAARAEAELSQAPGDRHLVALNIILRGAVNQLARVTFGEARVATAARQARIDALSEVAAAVPGQRKGRHSVSRSSAILKLAPVAIILGLLRRSLARHPALAAAKTALAAHKIAALTTSAVAAGGTAAVVAVSALGPNATLPFTGSAGSQDSMPGWHTSASPITSLSPVALLTKPRPKHAGDGKHLMASTGLPLPVYTTVTDPTSSSVPSSASSPAVSVQAGPAVLTVSATSLDLSNPLDPQATITLSASGGGWVSWRVDTSGNDLDFSQSHGVLQAGQSIVLTVSVDPAQALDGNTQQSFEIDGQQVTVALPPPVAAVVPTAVPSVLPTALPS
jgi:hypothetical protein